MANPTLSVAYDKATYAPGEQIVATVTYADADTRDVTDVWTASNDNGDNATITIVRHVVDLVTLTAPAGFIKVSTGDTMPQTWHGTA